MSPSFFDFRFFERQANIVAGLIQRRDPLGPMGEEREENQQMIAAGVGRGWTTAEYCMWFAGYLRAARQLKAITPEQEDELYDIVDSAAWQLL